MQTNSFDTDVVIVGAGLAGTVAAAVLGRQHRVVLVDPRATCPPVFKAEKIESTQAALLRELGLFETLLPHAGQVDELWRGYGNRVFERAAAEQYGLPYSTLVNVVASAMPAGVERRVAKVERILNSDDLQTVRLAGGSEVRARLVIVACGYSSDLLAPLGFQRKSLQRNQSVTFGFDVQPLGGQNLLGSRALTYYAKLGSPERMDYITLFPFRNVMRGNLFAFHAPSDPWVRTFMADPVPVLQRAFPQLESIIGPYAITGRVEAAGVELYRTEGKPVPGVVLLGDANQSVCPSTGTGLTKALTDVQLLSSRYVPQWLATPGMGVEKTAAFVSDAEKQSTDGRSLNAAGYRRQLAVERSFKWTLHRTKLELSMGLNAARLRLQQGQAASFLQ